MMTDAWATSVRLDRYSSALTMAAHQHPETLFSIVVNGGYEERIRGRIAQHVQGHMLVCPAFEQHAQQFHPVGAATIRIAPSPAAIDYLGERLRLSDAPYVQSAALADLGLRIAEELRRRDDFSTLVVQGLIMEALGVLLREKSLSGIKMLPWLRTTKAFIEAHFSEVVSIADLARVAGRHPIHLSRAFRQTFGQTVGDCMREARVQHAARLLRSNTRPIGDIAAECGFCDQAHLSRSFKRVFGTTPSAYRLACR
jgi:AraC family transcriptional regulator